MKVFFLMAATLGFLACGSNNTETVATETVTTASGEYMLDSQTSVLNWKGSMVGVYAHTGTMKFTDGNISVENGKIKSATFTVDMKSMVTNDDDALYKMAPREKLVEHLQGDDFFSSEKFPTSTFVFESYDGANIKGKLTIKGVTNDETVTDVVLTEANGSITASGKLVFDRQKYGVSYKAGMKDMVLSNDIELAISLTGKTK